MSKSSRRFDGTLSLAARVAAPLLAVALAASCGSKVSGTTSGNPSGTGTGSPGATTTGAGGDSSATGTSTAATGTGSGGAGGMMAPKCAMDADCATSPIGKVCDTQTGACVACLAGMKDNCAQGQFCDPATNTCKIGCTDDMDCMTPGNMNLKCDLTTNSCVGCLLDTDCPLGSVCATANHVCVAGCSPTQGCAMGESCCGTTCFDLTNNVNHCGDCAKKCVVPDHAAVTCIMSMCGMGACDMGWADCNGDTTDGCEWNTLQDGPCTCAPGSTQACYQGAPNSQGVGPCKGGTQTCDMTGTTWGPCVGQVLPQPEICANNIDDDCDNIVDNVADADADGWTTCNGDCCDSAGPNCASPALVNPGAFEVIGNGIDDDCDPATSDVNPPAACSQQPKFAGVNATDIAQAMDICQSTTNNPPLPLKKWGLIQAQQLLAGGQVPLAADLTNLQSWQDAVLSNYGTGGIVPHKGPTFAGMSSGKMRDANDPGYVQPNGGTGFTSSSTAPAAYLAANGNKLPSSAGCSGACSPGTGAYDSSNVRLNIRVPTNAKSFSYDFRFFSAEYWSWQCTQYNDFYLAILQTGAPGIPADKNITFDANNNPVSVNNGFFQVCTVKGCNTCPSGTGELTGTGMEVFNTGGGTTWLTTDAPILPGEVMQLELMVFDVSDHVLDSLVILDNFRWNLTPAAVNTHM
jgi:Putative metal-binding motif